MCHGPGVQIVALDPAAGPVPPDHGLYVSQIAGSMSGCDHFPSASLLPCRAVSLIEFGRLRTAFGLRRSAFLAAKAGGLGATA